MEIQKAGFHLRWSGRRNRKRSRKSAYDIVKIKNRSHKRDRIGGRRIRTFPFSSDSAYDSVFQFLIQWKSDCRSRKQKGKYKPITIHVPTLCDWFGSSASASVPSRRPSFHLIVNDGVVGGIRTLFSPDGKVLRFWQLRLRPRLCRSLGENSHPMCYFDNIRISA